MYIKLFIFAIAFYFLFRFILRVVWPLIQISRATQAKIKEMQEQMSQMNPNHGHRAPGTSTKKQEESRQPEGEYIEFEEIKG